MIIVGHVFTFSFKNYMIMSTYIYIYIMCIYYLLVSMIRFWNNPQYYSQSNDWRVASFESMGGQDRYLEIQRQIVYPGLPIEHLFWLDESKVWYSL